MSLTLQSYPGDKSSVHGDLIFTVADAAKVADPVTYPGFKFIADVYIGATLVTRLKAYPHPDTGIGVFNVGGVIRNYIAVNFSPTVSVLRAQENGSGEFYIAATLKLGEEYDFTIYTNVVEDSERTYFGHYNGRMLGQLTNLSDYNNRPASNRPVATPVDKNSKFNFVPYFPTSTNQVDVQIISYTKDGSVVQTYNTSFTPSAAYTMQLLNLSPQVLNGLSPGLIVDGITSYYTVSFSPQVFSGSYGFTVSAGVGNSNICAAGLSTLYSLEPYAEGVIMYTDAGCTTPLTGYNFIKTNAGIVNLIDSATGEVGAHSGPDC